MDNNYNPPAFPTVGWEELSSGKIVTTMDNPGMDLRDYFAAKALQSIILTVPEQHKTNGGWIPDQSYEMLVQDAYKIADAMLKERSKEVK
jgi:hypothetical protein